MDVREKLVELIAQKVCETWSGTCDQWLPHDCGKCYANDCHISEIADHLISNDVTIQKWISVKDRLPEPWKQVLIYSRHDFCEVALYIGLPGKWRVTWNHEMLDADSVTHWMPLAQPPKGE